MNIVTLFSNLFLINLLPMYIYIVYNNPKAYKQYRERDVYYFIYLFFAVSILYITFRVKFLILLPVVSILLWIIVLEVSYYKTEKIERKMLKLIKELSEKLHTIKDKQNEVDMEYKKISDGLNKYATLFNLVREINENVSIDRIGGEFYSKIVQYFGHHKIVYTGLIAIRKKEIVEIKSFSPPDNELLNQVSTALVEKQDLSSIADLSYFKIYSNHLEYILLVKHYLDSEAVNNLHFFVDETKMGFIRGILFEEVEKLSRVDGLTGLYLRRYFISRLNTELLRALRYKTTFSLIMIDIDFFKKINDTYGHIVGDFILKSVAKTFVDTVKDQGFCSRWGGEEFLIFLPYQGLKDALKVAESIRSNVENSVYQYGDKEIKITVSCGISSFPEEGNKIDDLIEIADKKLYDAKRAGRNRVVV